MNRSGQTKMKQLQVSCFFLSVSSTVGGRLESGVLSGSTASHAATGEGWRVILWWGYFKQSGPGASLLSPGLLVTHTEEAAGPLIYTVCLSWVEWSTKNTKQIKQFQFFSPTPTVIWHSTDKQGTCHWPTARIFSHCDSSGFSILDFIFLN